MPINYNIGSEEFFLLLNKNMNIEIFLLTLYLKMYFKKKVK